ncbi:MAG: hypothetical protein ABUL60_03245 [Myxococcales bacterium]
MIGPNSSWRLISAKLSGSLGVENSGMPWPLPVSEPTPLAHDGMTSHAKSSPLPVAANLQLFVFASKRQLAIQEHRDDFACEVIPRPGGGQKLKALQHDKGAKEGPGAA